MKGLVSLYHSVNTFHFSISTGGELEYLKPAEKALRSEEVAIVLKFVFISGS